MTFVVSSGQLASLERSGMPAVGAIRLSDTLSQDYATIWRTQPQVRTVVSFLARNIAQLGLHVFDRVSDTDRKRLRDHPLAELIGQPNPWTTRYRLVDALIQDLGTYDNAFWLKIKRTDGRPAVVRIRPTMVEPVGESWWAAEQFKIRGTRGEKTVDSSQVVHFRGHNPSDDRFGISPIESLRGLLAEEYQASLFREQLWRNGARFAGYLRRPKDAPKWSSDARERFRSQWQGQYAGSGPNAGGTPILEDGMEWQQAGLSPEAAQYIEARKLTREEVAAAYHIPLPMVGILDHATFSNITEQHKQLYQDTLGPWLTMVTEELALQLLPDLDASTTVYLEFNLAEKLRGSFEEQAQQLQSAVGAPWLTRNEARARQNLPSVPGGDALVVPLNVLVGGQASPTDSAPSGALSRRGVKARVEQTHVAKATQVMKSFFDRQEKALLAQLGSAKARGKAADLDDVWDGDRWDDELAADLFALNALLATAAGRKAAESIGLEADEYDEDRTLAWLKANAAGAAAGINNRTKAALEAALGTDDPLTAVKDLYAGPVAARAAQIAATQATAMSGFGTNEAVQQSGLAAVKTWTVTSARPRPSHASMNGESVAVGEVFSNGARWPGDSSLSDDERAGCTCDMDISVEA